MTELIANCMSTFGLNDNASHFEFTLSCSHSIVSLNNLMFSSQNASDNAA